MYTPPPRRAASPHLILPLALLLAFSSCLAAQQSPPPSQPLTVESIFGAAATLSSPPDEFFWSPDSTTVAYFATHSTSHPRIASGDLVALNARTLRTRVLIPQSQIADLFSADSALSPRERDHRNRYDQPPLLWSPDAKSLLLDADGTLDLYDIAHHRARSLTAAAPANDDPKFSPDGKFISYLRNHSLYLRDLRSNHETEIARGDPTHLAGEVTWLYLEELSTRSNYFWSPDSSRIAWLLTDQSRVPTTNFPDAAIPDAGPPQHYPTPGSPNPALHLFITNIANPAHPREISLPLSQNNDYIPRFGWLTPTTLWIEILDRSQQRLRLYCANAATGALALIYTESDQKYLYPDFDFTFLPAQHEFLRVQWRDSQTNSNDGHSHLYLYRYAANATAPAAPPCRLTPPGDYDVDSLLGVSPDGDRAFFTSNQSNPLGREFFSVSLSTGLITRLSYDANMSGPTTHANGTHQISLSPNAAAWIDSESTATWSGSVSLNHAGPEKKNTFTLDPAKRLFNSLGAFADSISYVFWERDDKLPSPPITLTLRAADNSTPLYAQLTLPPAEKIPAPHSIPVVLNPYGGPEEQQVRDKWRAEDTLFNQLLAQHGIAVLTIDNRGMSMRGRAFAQAAWRNFGALQLSDQISALDQTLARYPQLDPNRIGIWGWSYGGYLTLYGMTHSTRFTSGIAVAPVSDWRLYDSAFTERYLGTPAQNPAAYANSSTLAAAAHLHGHLLLAYGLDDDNVHPQNSTSFARALRAAHLHYDSLDFPDETHDFSSPADFVRLYSLILAQFQHDLAPAQ